MTRMVSLALVVCASFASCADSPEPCLVLRVVSADTRHGVCEATRTYRSVEAAQRAIRAYKREHGLPSGGVRVVVSPGVYEMKDSFVFNNEDSGEEGRPVIWSAEKDGAVVFDGGIEIEGWAPLGPEDEHALRQVPASAAGKVRVAKVPACGALTQQLRYGGATRNGTESVTDLYFNDEPLAIAREPNEGFLMTGGVTNRTWFKSDVMILGKLADERNPMACGYWHWRYLDETARIDGIAPDGRIRMNREIFDNRFYTVMHTNMPYFVVNALCALDRPGEWYLDVRSSRLYLYPMSETGSYTLSALSVPFVSVTNAHDITFRGFRFKCGRNHGLVATDVQRVRIESCDFMQLGGVGIRMKSARGSHVSHCRLDKLGHGGIELTAGDRRTLEPGLCSISDCEISRPDRHKRTYAPAVMLDGVGTVVEHNHLHDCRSSAINMRGNDMTIAYNLVERAVLESDDQGALDTYGYVSFQGNRIIANVWRDIGHENFSGRKAGQAGVRLDDVISCVTIVSNRFIRASTGHFGAIQINQGCRNVIENNLFEDCRNERAAAITFSPCTEWYWQDWLKRRKHASSVWGEDMLSPAYIGKYPALADVWDWPKKCKDNIVHRNIVVGTGHCIVGAYWRKPDRVYDDRAAWAAGNCVVEDASCAVEAAKRIGFKPLPPLSAVGPRASCQE